jgi:hypothetical protein
MFMWLGFMVNYMVFDDKGNFVLIYFIYGWQNAGS